MAGLSKIQLLTWFREKPQTMNWGAILAFNRTDTNTVLLQDYIQRFSNATYLEPVQGYIGDSSTVGQYITDYVMDYPRLSFEIAAVENDIPSAKLTMKVVGGTQVTFSDVPGGREATRIEVVDPLNGPELTLNLQLVDVPGGINHAGQVVLDLKRSSNFSLSYSDFETERKLGGEFFQQLFEALPADKRVMVISEIAKQSENAIKPASIKLRTQAAPGAKMRSAENYGDGAVLVFVAMEGEAAGSNPTADFKYLIPNDASADCSATIVLSNKLLMEKIIGQALIGEEPIDEEPIQEGVIRVEGPSYSLRYDAAGFATVVGDSGGIPLPPLEYHLSNFKASIVYRSLMLYDDINNTPIFAVSVSNDSLCMSWGAIAWSNMITSQVGPSIPGDVIAYIRVNSTLEATGQYLISKSNQELEVSYFHTVLGLSGSSLEHSSNDSVSPGIFDTIKSAIEDQYIRDLEAKYPLLLSKFPSINIFVLKSLLFKNGDAVALDDVALPGDLVMFGRVGPSLTHFAIKPLQPLMGAGDTLQLSIEPAQPGVTWTVEHILGGSGDKGSISTSGLYTAPAAISGAFIRVKVTAAAPGGYSQAALVSVVVNDITVSPLIQTCDAGHPRSLSAGTKGTGQLSWSLKTPANGAKLVAGQNGQYIYTAPPSAGNGDAAFVVDEIVVKNELTGKTKSAYVMATLAVMALSVQKDNSVSLPANQIKLQVKSSSTTIGDDRLTWTTAAGAGAVVNGIYTQPEPLDQRFVLLVASFAPDPVNVPDLLLQGYILLPLPLFDYPQNLVPGLSFTPA